MNVQGKAARAASFVWNDPFLLEDQLSDEERMIRDTAAAFAASSLAPKVEDAYLNETTDPGIFRAMGEAGLLLGRRCAFRVVEGDTREVPSLADGHATVRDEPRVVDGDIGRIDETFRRQRDPTRLRDDQKRLVRRDTDVDESLQDSGTTLLCRHE